MRPRSLLVIALTALTLGCAPSFRDQCMLEVAGSLKESAQIGTALHMDKAHDDAIHIIKGIRRFCDELEAVRQE